MSKQIIYTSLIPRLFSAMLDFTILLLVLSPLMNYLASFVYIFKFGDVFAANNIEVTNLLAIQAAFRDPEFLGQINLSEIVICMLALNLINISLMGVYFVFFWYKFRATPGKFITCMRVVDQDEQKNLTIKQGVKRFCAYVTAIIGIWSIIFNKKGLALHDKLAGSVVIKS